MSKRLIDAADELAADLKRSLGCYLVVGWIKDPDKLVLYIDENATFPSDIGSLIPNKYRGYPVDVQLIKPPSVRF